MELIPQKQIAKLLKEKEKILIVTHVKPDGDSVSSALALFLVLDKVGKKNVRIVCADPMPEIFEFLPSNEKIEQKKSFPKDFVISLDCSKVSVDKLRWNNEDSKLNIIITPKDGKFVQDNVVFSEKQEDFDLIVALDVADKEQLGSVFFDNTEMFSDTPIINIDHHVSNTNFGLINLVDPTASSSTEVLFSLFSIFKEVFGRDLLDENIATLLLTGIITDTGSFQNPNTTPRSFEVAADLIEAGARQQEIIRRLFKTKSLPTLKLWGKVLSRIKNDPIHRFVWSTVSADDLEATGAHSDDLAGVLDDLLSNAPGAEIVLLLKEREDGIVGGSLRTTSPAINGAKIAQMFNGGGHIQAAGFKIPKKGRSFESITDDVITRIKQFQAERLELPDASGKLPDSSGQIKESQEEAKVKSQEIRGELQDKPQNKAQDEVERKETVLEFNSGVERDAENVVDIIEKLEQDAGGKIQNVQEGIQNASAKTSVVNNEQQKEEKVEIQDASDKTQDDSDAGIWAEDK